MQAPTARPCAAVAVLFLAAAAAQAEPVPWYYGSAAIPGTLVAGQGGPGKVVFTDVSSGLMAGNATIRLADLDTVSSARNSDPAHFKHANYQVAVTILDANSNQTGTLFFSGWLSGKLSSGKARLHNHFTGDRTLSEVLGDHRYTVTIGPYTRPGAPGGKSGRISATVKISDVPEPAALPLAAVGLSLLGAGWWWRRRQERSAASA